MKEILILCVLGFVECGFCFISIWKKRYFHKEKAIVAIAESAVFVLCFIAGIFTFSFSYYLLLIYLLGNAAWGIAVLLGKDKKEKKEKGPVKRVCLLAGRLAFIGFVMIPCFMFPDVALIKVTGEYKVGTVNYTWTDDSRLEEFLSDGSNRQVSVQFWYPETDGNQKKKFPLVVFSHGAFGFGMSNDSTYHELASNGYIVCSVEHPYHAFFSAQTDGTVVMADRQFMNEVREINLDSTSEEEIFRITRPWLELRALDLNFVLDTIMENALQDNQDVLFSMVDMGKIGMMGHSLGGAAAVEIGRSREGIGAVISLDATMLGEELACENGQYTIQQEPYPVPLLSIDTRDHFLEGQSYGNLYVNNVILENAKDGMELNFYDAGHMNFTDLPLFSPFLAKLLGIGTVDIRYCITQMNEIILDYYDYYLKGVGDLESLRGEPGKIERGY